MDLAEIIKAVETNADLSGEITAHTPVGYSIDSRTVRKGELFFAIRGEAHDGHRFVGDALARGAVAAVVSMDFAASEAGADKGRLIPVRDTLRALQQLASAVLRSWQGREVAITGSSGKTTTKEMTARTLEACGRVIKTTGNFNNAYGLPLSILRMETDGARAADFDFAVLEMGMNHAGEITELTRVAPPHLGVVTNVAAVHLEFFESVDAIADAKAELVLGVRKGGAAVLNADDPRVRRMRDLRPDIEFRMYGIENEADVRALEVKAEGIEGTSFKLVTPRGSTRARLPVAGRHNLYNALAAAAVSDYYEAPLEAIADNLGAVSSSRMRGEVIRFAEGFSIIDDSYNSNPRALVEMAATMCGDSSCRRRIVVAGEMLELGEAGAALHREAGRKIAELGVDLLIGVRGLAREIVEGAREAGLKPESALFCETVDEAASVLEGEAREGDLILVKGSRGVKTETVVERMKQRREVMA